MSHQPNTATPKSILKKSVQFTDLPPIFNNTATTKTTSTESKMVHDRLTEPHYTGSRQYTHGGWSKALAEQAYNLACHRHRMEREPAPSPEGFYSTSSSGNYTPGSLQINYPKLPGADEPRAVGSSAGAGSDKASSVTFQKFRPGRERSILYPNLDALDPKSKWWN